MISNTLIPGSLNASFLSVNEAFPAILQELLSEGELTDTRNGLVKSLPGVSTITYQNPRHRVLFSPERDANPFFHVAESLWMLAGRDDLEYVEYFAKNMASFSSNGRTLHGAYGQRWYRYDQIQTVIEQLRSNPDSRRVVLSMWDAVIDLADTPENAKDKPCNLMVLFEIRKGRLNMTVFNRSNDAVWGTFGANAVHFSFLQEYIACSVGVEVGVYNQVSNNLHLYTESLYGERLFNNLVDSSTQTVQYPLSHFIMAETEDAKHQTLISPYNLYFEGLVDTSPLILNPLPRDSSSFANTISTRMKVNSFRSHLNDWIDDFLDLKDSDRISRPHPDLMEISPFIREVAYPLLSVIHKTHKKEGPDAALGLLTSPQKGLDKPLNLCYDWHTAAIWWLNRRLDPDRLEDQKKFASNRLIVPKGRNHGALNSNS